MNYGKRSRHTYPNIRGIRTWQSLDGSVIKAPLARESTGKKPTDRGKMGTRRSVINEKPAKPIKKKAGFFA
jgi:hypothetical protein